MRKLIVIAVLAVLAGSAVTGCDSQACTLVGCGASFRVDFKRTGWTPGSYTVTAIADGESIECSAALPLDCDAPSPCPDMSRVILLREGCALDPSQHSIAGLEFQDGFAPKSIEIQVVQDDVLIGEGAYTPVYSESFPNGPECGPPCVGAESALLELE